MSATTSTPMATAAAPTTKGSKTAPAAGVPAAPALPADLEALLRRPWLPQSTTTPLTNW